MTRQGVGLPVAVQAADAVPLRATRTRLHETAVCAEEPTAAGAAAASTVTFSLLS